MLTVLAQDQADYKGGKIGGPFQAYKNSVCLLPNELDEKVANLYFLALGTELNVPTQTQTDYTGVKVETGQPSFEMLCSFTDQALAQVGL